MEPRGQEIKRAAAASSPTLKTLQSARERLTRTIEGRFSDYANATLLWEDRSNHIPSAVAETDPLSVQFCKHSLLAMQDVEQLVEMIQKLSASGFMPRAGENLTELYELGKLLYKGLIKHLNELSEIALAANIPPEALRPLQLVQAAFSGIALESMTGENMMRSMQQQIGNSSAALDDAMGALVDTYFNSRAAAPQTPEAKYQLPAAKQGPWDPNLSALQERREWFSVLLEPVRDTTSKVAFLTNMLSRHIAEAEAKGQKFNEEEKALIDKTSQALKESKIDEHGYYLYSSHETPLSQSLKAIFNVLWAVNELSRGYWERSRIGAVFQSADHGLKALDHFFKIDWMGIGGDLKEVFDQLMNAVLVEGRDAMLPTLIEFTRNLHQTELQNGFRYGAMLDDVRPMFEQIESLYLSRGLPISNPFGAVEKEKQVYEEKLTALKRDEEKTNLQGTEINKLSNLLSQYEKLGNLMGGGEKKAVGKAAAGIFYFKVPVAVWPSFIAGVGQVYDAFISDMILKPGMVLVEAAATGMVNIAEMVNRAYTNFPREELLEALVQAREIEVLSGEEVPDWSAVQDRLISEMTLDQRKAFAKKILRDHQDVDQYPDSPQHLSDHWTQLKRTIDRSVQAEEREAKRQEDEAKQQYRITRAARAAVSAVKGAAGAAATKVWEGWPPANLSNLIAAVKKKNIELAQQRQELHAYTEGLQVREKVGLEYAVRALQNDGLVPFLSAAGAAASDEKTNRPQKRRLAVILADFNHADRAAYLNDAHDIASAFVKDRNGIQNLIMQLYESKEPQQKALGHALAVEVTLAGYVNTNQWTQPQILVSTDAQVIRQDLIHALDRLEASQVLNMMKPSDPDTCARFVFLNDHLFPQEKLSDIPTPDQWVQLMVSRYQSLEKTPPVDRELMNKMGLFLGRLAHADEAMAKIIFAQEEARNILHKECVEAKQTEKTKPDQALYYESLVNTFVMEVKAAEGMQYADFLRANNKAILEMHTAMHPNDSKSNDEIVANYGRNAWALCQLTEGFIAKHTSPGSLAENRLREFFSAITLCLGEECRVARERIIEDQEKVRGSAQARYIKLLTTAASHLFWNKVRDDLVSKPHQELIQQMDDLTRPLLAATTNERIKAEIKKYVAGQRARLERLSQSLAKTKDILIKSRYVLQEMQEIKKATQDNSAEWDKEIKQAEELERLKTSLLAEFKAKETEVSQHGLPLEKRINAQFQLVIDEQKRAAEAVVTVFHAGNVSFDQARQTLEHLARTVDQNHQVWVSDIRDLHEIKKLHEEFLEYSGSKINSLRDGEGLEEKEQQQLISLIEQQRNQVQQVVNEFNAGRVGFAATQGVIQQGRQQVDAQYDILRQKQIAERQRIEQQKQVEEKQRADRANLDHLQQQVKEILKVLKEYLRKRKGIKASAMAVFGFDLRKNKVQLVEKFVQSFEEKNSGLTNAQLSDYPRLAAEVYQLAEGLNMEHNALLKSAAAAEQEKGGKLGERVSIVRELAPQGERDDQSQRRLPGSAAVISRMLPAEQRKAKKEPQLNVRSLSKMDKSDDLPNRIRLVFRIAKAIKQAMEDFLSFKPKGPNHKGKAKG